MIREEAVKEIEKAFEPAFANYIITALTEGATVSDKALEQEPILDKILAEANAECISDGFGRYIRFDVLEKIIDKHKAESEK